MTDDDVLLLAGLAGVIVLSSSSPTKVSVSDLAWTWPLPRRGGRPPVISQGYSYPRHKGADLMYAAAGAPASWARAKPLNPLVPPLFAAPIGGEVVAALPGIVWQTGDGDRGQWVMLDHGEFGEKLTTWYQHLSRVDVKKGQRVAAGQVLGGLGADPTDAQHVVHLHFEVSRWSQPGKPSQLDPAPFLRGARYVDA